MLEGNGDKDEIPSTVTDRVREVLARNIAARNHGLSPTQFAGAVTTLHSSLIAARLLEEAGIFRHGSVKEVTRINGLIEGLSSLLGGPTGRDGGSQTWLTGTDALTWPDLSICRNLAVDPKVTARVVSLTNEKKFFDEWVDPWSDSHERTLLVFLRSSARLSHDGRMVIGEQFPYTAGPGVPALPREFIEKVARDLVLPWLSGKTPKNAGVRLIDPACRTGRILLAMYNVVIRWHLSWYLEHLIPLLVEGRDPASRKVQGMLPFVHPTENRAGYQRFGTLPLPVYQLPDGRWELTWDEKVRILGDSLSGIDSDPGAVEITRLSILSFLLNNTGDRNTDSAGIWILRGILARNIRYGNVLIGKDYEEQPSLFQGPGINRPDIGILKGDEFPGAVSDGGFGVVFSMFPSVLPFPGKDLQDYLCRHYKSGRPEDATTYYLECGLSLARPGGVLCGIVSGSWQRSGDAALFRGWLAGHEVESIVGLGNLSIFAGMRDPLMITIKNHPPGHLVRVSEALQPPGDGRGEISFRFGRKIAHKSLGSSLWMLRGLPPAEVRKKIDSAGTPLARYILGEYLLAEKDEYPGFVISRKEYEIIVRKDPVMGTFIFPFVTTGEIRRYHPGGYSRYIVRIPPGTTNALAGEVPDLREWFFNHHHTLAVILMKHHQGQVQTGPDDACWWEWPGPATPQAMEGPVLLTRASGESGGPEWMIASRVYPGARVLAIPCTDPALPGILNSSLARFYILSSARKKGMPGYLLPHLMRFPLPVPETEDLTGGEPYKKIADLVEKRQIISKAGDPDIFPEEVTTTSQLLRACDEEIDTLVYELYGLSDEETAGIGEWLSREDHV
jgi:hypothetical protein